MHVQLTITHIRCFAWLLSTLKARKLRITFYGGQATHHVDSVDIGYSIGADIVETPVAFVEGRVASGWGISKGGGSMGSVLSRLLESGDVFLAI